MSTRTIPRAKRSRMDRKAPPPIFRELAAEKKFDPYAPIDTAFTDWDFDKTYPPTVGELMLGLAPAETEQHDAQSDQASSGVDPGGSREPVPGQSEDGDPLDDRREDCG